MAVHERKSRKRHHPQHLIDLRETLTVPEAALCWGKHTRTVKLAIDTGRLAARKAGTVWLVSFWSLVDLWGEPNEHIEEIDNSI